MRTTSLREALEQLDLLGGHRRALRRHRVVDADLVQRHDVEVALDDERAPAAADGVLGQVQAEEVLALLVEDRLRRVLVLRLVFGVDDAPAEADDLAHRRRQRVDDAVDESVEVRRRSRRARRESRPRALGELDAATFFASRWRASASQPAGAKPTWNFSRRRVVEAARLDVRARRLRPPATRAARDRTSRRGRAAEPCLARSLSAARAALLASRRAARLGELDARLLRQLAQRLHEATCPRARVRKRDHVARLAAAEAVEELLLRVDVERGRLLVVKRAQPLVVDARCA